MVDTLSALRQNSSASQATTGAAAAGTATTGEKNVALKSLANNFDNFLTILTSQLQNQDPMDPLDSSEFTNQLVLFAGVEQDIAQNTNLEKVIEKLESSNNQLNSAVSYIGKDIEATGNQINHASGQSSSFVYDLPQTAKTVTININDSAGRLVRQVTGPVKVGRNEFVWNGKNTAGTNVASGIYSYSIQATNSKDEAISNIVTHSLGKVVGVKNDPKTKAVTLELSGNFNVPLNNVTRVK